MRRETITTIMTSIVADDTSLPRLSIVKGIDYEIKIYSHVKEKWNHYEADQKNNKKKFNFCYVMFHNR